VTDFTISPPPPLQYKISGKSIYREYNCSIARGIMKLMVAFCPCTATYIIKRYVFCSFDSNLLRMMMDLTPTFTF
jgi:hypothetical protein